MTDPTGSDRGDGAEPDLGMPDLGGLLEGMQRMQAAQAAHYSGDSGGGAVRIEATGALEFTGVTIAAEALATGDVELVQDLVLAALHDLTARVAAAHRDAVGDVGDLGLGDLGLGGLSLGDLGLGLGGLGEADRPAGVRPIDVRARDDPSDDPMGR